MVAIASFPFDAYQEHVWPTEKPQMLSAVENVNIGTHILIDLIRNAFIALHSQPRNRSGRTGARGTVLVSCRSRW